MYLLVINTVYTVDRINHVRYEIFLYSDFLIRVHGGWRPVHTWFLKIAFLQKVNMRVCVCIRPKAVKPINN